MQKPEQSKVENTGRWRRSRKKNNESVGTAEVPRALETVLKKVVEVVEAT